MVAVDFGPVLDALPEPTENALDREVESMIVEPQVSGRETEAPRRPGAPEGTPLPVWYVPPAPSDAGGGGKAPGLLVIQEAFGVNDHIRDVCLRFARLGYAVVSPDLYWRDGRWLRLGYDDFASARPLMARLTEEAVLADLETALDFLAAQPEVDAERLGAVGYCMGGRLTWLLASRRPGRLRVAAVYYGGGIVPGLLPESGPAGLPREMPPLIGFFGGRDRSIPEAHVRRIDQVLEEAGVAHAIYFYPEAEHGFFCDQRPSFSARAAEDAWYRTRLWFGRHLPPAGAAARPW